MLCLNCKWQLLQQLRKIHEQKIEKSMNNKVHQSKTECHSDYWYITDYIIFSHEQLEHNQADDFSSCYYNELKLDTDKNQMILNSIDMVSVPGYITYARSIWRLIKILIYNKWQGVHYLKDLSQLSELSGKICLDKNLISDFICYPCVLFQFKIEQHFQ